MTKQKFSKYLYYILFCAMVHDFSWNFNFTKSEVKLIFYEQREGLSAGGDSVTGEADSAATNVEILGSQKKIKQS